MSSETLVGKQKRPLNWRRLAFIFLGIGLFTATYLAPSFAPAEDPDGKVFELTRSGQAAIGLFLLAGTWWVFEVVPIGITSILIGVVQALFLIRPDIVTEAGERISGVRVALTDFMAPSVWFIIGSIVVGMVFTRTGLTKRMAYRMLILVGERTSMIYLGTFVMTGMLTLIMAHTAVAATVFPLLMAIYSLYGEGERPTKFGKGLFMGMAFVAGAGSIITLLGAARGAVAIGFYKSLMETIAAKGELTYAATTDITFLGYTKYLAPVGVVMIALLWGFFMLVYRPERRTIPGLRERARELHQRLGPITGREILTLAIVGATIGLLLLRSIGPACEAMPFLKSLDKSAVILVSTVLFFLFEILSIKDLEEIPWNVILLFGGAMSIGYCLWQTGAAQWLAIKWLTLLESAPAFVFIMGVAGFVLLMTNFIMNVAAIAITLPVALVMAPYLGVSYEVIMFSSLVVAGMPFLLLVGAAPNAIAYESKQFTTGEFFLAGIPASILLMVVLAGFVAFVWPLMGMPIFV